ncbi:MAG: PSD1 and planctomycete cytochrome C domain-containing protein [Planctomycetota bacterium]
MRYLAAVRTITLVGLVVFVVGQSRAENRSGLDAQRVAFFEAKVRPLLVEHCYECHSGESEGGLRLDGPRGIRVGGHRGPAVVPGDIDASLLIRAVQYADPEMEMPPSGQLEPLEIDSLVKWVRDGAVDPRADADAPSSAEVISPMDRSPSSHWAFVAPKPINATSWQHLPNDPNDVDKNSHDPLDEISRHRAMEVGLSINPPAPREVLLRRLMFDLTGLPPTIAQIQAFKDDVRPGAIARQIDRLLADVQFAERFARHWLDVARYADTKGYALAGRQRELNGAHLYRQWVIAAFGNDMPYPDMIRHQLAADRTDPMQAEGHADAMGFLTLGRHFLRHDDTIDDRIDVISRGLMGLTVTCARCHDHKFDPIPTVDYYSLYNVLDNSVEAGQPTTPKRPNKKNEQANQDAASRTADSAGSPSPLMLVDRQPLRDTRVMIRGNRGNWGERAPRRYLTSFRPNDAPEFSVGSGRIDLAEEIVAVENPLTARVMVNRIWGHLMGRHLVDSPSDFGYRTKPPAVIELLDDLAAEFAMHGSVKRIVRRIVNTRMYQQASDVDEHRLKLDAENQFWARAERRRRDFESLRDSFLKTSDMIDTAIGGESVDITATNVVPRRTLYAFVDRQNLPGLFRTFDFANPDMHSPMRYTTTVPQQSLYLLNHPHLAELSRHSADLIRRQALEPSQHQVPTEALSDNQRYQLVHEAMAQVLAREPTRSEVARSTAFLSKAAEKLPEQIDPRSYWTYGTAMFHDDQLSAFRPLPIFDNGRWQAETVFPAAAPYSYAMLGKRNGHPGRGDDAVVVRRWTSPVKGFVEIRGVLGHSNNEGDGIDAIIYVDGRPIFREHQFSNRRPLSGLRAPIQPGQHVDFIVHSGPTTSHDGFFWEIDLRVTRSQRRLIEASSVNDFSGPIPTKHHQPLDRLAQFIQVLFLSNEFAFID